MEFNKCNTSEEFLTFFDNDEQAFRHTNYYHYTLLENINSILKAKQIRLTQLSKTANDLVEKGVYNELGSNIFSVCFSTGTSECLPLWYLYSGIDGRGARLGLKKKTLCKILENPSFLLLETECTRPYRLIGEPIELKKDDYKLLCRDILYIGRDSQKKSAFRIKYNGQVVNNLPKEEADKLQTDYRRFIKGLIWFYEKETRIQVEITNQKLLDPAKNYVIALKLDDIYEDISIRLAPEYGEITEEEFDKYDGIKEWTKTKLQKSEFAGQLRMNLSKKLCAMCDKEKEETKL